jgi:hypothetical protein
VLVSKSGLLQLGINSVQVNTFSEAVQLRDLLESVLRC